MTSVADRVRLVRDTIYNMVPPVASALMGLATVAFQLAYLPKADYGLWIGMHAIVATAMIVDFGIGWTITKAVGADPEARERATTKLLATAASALLLMAVFGSAIVFLSGIATASGFDLPESSTGLVWPAAAAAAVIYGANRITVYALAALSGQRRFDFTAFFSASQTVLIGAGTIYFAISGQGVLAIATFHAFTALAFMGLSLIIAPLPFRPRLAAMDEILNIGRFALASQIADLSLTTVWEAGELVIGFFAGAEAIVPFHVGMRIPKTLGSILVRSAEVLMPIGANIVAHGDHRADRKIVLDGVRWNLINAIPVTLALTILSPALLTLWLQQVDPEILSVQRIVLMAVLFDAGGNGILYFLWGRGAIRQVLIACIAKVVIGLGMTAILVGFFGPMGAALAVLIALAAVSLWLTTQVPAIQPAPRSGIAAICSGFFLPGVAAACATIILAALLPDPLMQLIVGSAGCVITFLTTFLLFGAHKEERRLAIALFKPSRRRLRHYRFLRSLWHLAIELSSRLSGRWRRGLSDSEALFADAPDPWGYREARHQKRFLRADAMVAKVRALLGGEIGTALEIACAEGHFTEHLAAAADSVTALDGSLLALDRAKARLSALHNIDYVRRNLTEDALPGGFDLVVADGILDYFRSRSTLKHLRRKLKDSVKQGGYLLLGNVRQHQIIETAPWARWLVRGGANVNEFIAAEDGFETVAVDIDAFYAYRLVRRM